MLELFKILGIVAVDNNGANNALSETADKAEESHGRMSSAFANIGKAALSMGKVVIEAAATVSTAAAAGFTALTKSSVENYAEYEQLVGGIETLFKDSSGRVIEYANYAFKSAGLSANEYMETVTSFSASLLQGLEGNTWQAADLANMAIKDMADNANKMGTSMESIQNAYQGFAKQNYTMLDNLKLGYGGTQEEMIRLINDSGILEESISSMDGITFDQILNAIHVVQTELGITGTTSQEAASTIQGSVSSMKAAWQNFLTGMSNEDANFTELTDSLVKSVVTVAGNIGPRLVIVVPRLLEGLKKVLSSLASKLPEMIGEMFPDAKEGIELLSESLKDTISTLMEDVIPTVFQTITQLIPPLLQIATEILPIISGIIKDILPVIVGILPPLMSLIQAVLPVISELMKALLPPIIQIVEALMPVLVDLIQLLLPPILKVVEMVLPLLMKLLNPILELLTPLMGILEPVLDIIMALLEPLLKLLDLILPPLVKIIGVIVALLADNLGKAIRVVADLLQNSLNKAFENIQIVVDTMKNVFATFIDFFKNVFAGNWSAAWDNIKNIFTSVWEGIQKVFKNYVNWIIGGVEILINGVIHSINGMLSGIGKVVSAVGDLLGLEWNMPSLSDVSLPRLAKGGILEQGQIGLLEGDGAEAVVPLERNREWIARVSEEMNVQGIGGDKETLNVLREILAYMADIKESNSELPDAISDAISNMKFSINRREFARLVKAV